MIGKTSAIGRGIDNGEVILTPSKWLGSKPTESWTVTHGTGNLTTTEPSNTAPYRITLLRSGPDWVTGNLVLTFPASIKKIRMFIDTRASGYGHIRISGADGVVVFNNQSTEAYSIIKSGSFEISGNVVNIGLQNSANDLTYIDMLYILK